MPELFSGWTGPVLVNAAGTVKSVEHARSLLGAPVPAVLMGSYTLEERAGNAGTTFHELHAGALNSMGLPSPPVGVWSRWVQAASAEWHAVGKQVWVSVAGFDAAEYRLLAEAAFGAGADAVELNLGCPNVWDHGRQKPIVSFRPQMIERVLSEVATLGEDLRLGVKLSPLLDPVLMDEVDVVIRSSGVRFLTCINTVPNCYAADGSGNAVITAGGGFAGLSGAAVKWIGLGQVKAHRERLPEMSIIGVGGVATGQDLFDYLADGVGVTATQVGTAFLQRGPRVFSDILSEYVEVADAA